MEAWNKGKRVGQKKAFKLEDIWRIRIRLELAIHNQALVVKVNHSSIVLR